MKALFNEEELMLKAVVREFADRELIPKASEYDKTESFPWDNIHSLSSMGLMGLTIPEEYGGANSTYAQLMIAVEELARGCAATSVIHLTHLSLGSESIIRFGSKTQQGYFLPKLASGEFLAAFALTEPSSGSDASDIQTIALRTKEGYTINGSKTFITNGPEADVLIVFAATDPNDGAHGISAFLVQKDTPGLNITEQKGKMGMRASSTAELSFVDCHLNENERLGLEGEGFHIAMSIIDSSRMTVAAQAIGIGQAALEEALKYSNHRETFGKKLVHHQAIQFMLADMATRLEAARLLTRRAAQLKDSGREYTKETAMAKLAAAEAAHYVCDKALQIHGGYGYFNSSVVERLYRDQRVTEIYEGTSEIQRLVIARNLIKEQ